MSFEELSRIVTFRPLDPGHVRSGKRKASPFEVNWRKTVELLTRELQQIKAKDVICQLDVGEHQLRNDGMIRADARLEYQGVVLSMDSKHGSLRYMCDQFTTRQRWRESSPLWQHNLRAIALGMEALRKVDRYGITQSGEQYRGFRALPDGTGAIATGMTLTDAYDVLAKATESPVEWVQAYLTTAHKKARAKAHPDKNEGDRKMWDLVEQAWQVIERTRR